MDEKEKKKLTPKTTLFQFKNVDAALVYVQLKEKLGLKTEKECHNLLVALAQMGYMQRVQQTARTPDQIAADLKQHGFNVLDKRAPVEQGGTKGMTYKPPPPISNKAGLFVLVVLLFTLGTMLVRYLVP